jgi:hypothetical protein
LGRPGWARPHEVTRTLKALGLEKDHDYHHIRGYASARGLYETLYNHNGRIIVFDDCDNALTDAVSVELLKGALDSYDVRSISWLSASKKAGPIPPKFDFTGGVVFVSNRRLEEIDAPVHTRSYCQGRSFSLNSTRQLTQGGGPPKPGADTRQAGPLSPFITSSR